MKQSLRVLMTGIIDYAGLFPPAQLPLAEAVRNYARYRQEPERWMLGRFVCPAARLGELSSLLDQLASAETPVPVSVLGQGSGSLAEFTRQVAGGVRELVAFGERHGASVAADAFEVKLPDELVHGPMGDAVETTILAVAVVVDTLLSECAGAGRGVPAPVAISYEAGGGKEWRRAVDQAVAALAREHVLVSCESRKHVRPAGFKLRCGGLEAPAFPSPELVAAAIAACRDAGIPMKFTAGLHHPMRHFNDSVRCKMHGFINVFVAGVMAHARGLTAEQLQPIIDEENPAEFVFIDEGVRWRDCFATTGEMRAARQQFVTSFGSCSFDEPRDDLRALGWM